jgi:hypothetical protein
MLAAIFAAIATFQKILLREDNISFLGIVEILWVKLGPTEIIIHFVHICKVNKKEGLGLWRQQFPFPL